MLKKRLVACLVVKNGIVVQSIGFKRYLPVGSVEISVEALNRWGIDEIIILDIDATAQNRKPDFELVVKASKKSFVPLTMGGGIQSLEDIRQLIHYGADKISINKSALIDPDLIRKGAKVFGNQCIVVSIDIKKRNGKYQVFSDSAKNNTSLSAVDWAKRVEDFGAGEIFLNSIDKDGSKRGYDIELINMVSNAVSIPVVACGGVGHPKDFLEGIVVGKASAVAAGNFFHFTEHSPVTVKAYLSNNGIGVRYDSYANYKDFNFQGSGRIDKRDDDYLNSLKFDYYSDEVI